MVPVQVSFHGIPPSDAVTALAEEHAQKLSRYSRDLIRCRVHIDRPHHHHVHGDRYRVRIDLLVPGDEIIVSREPSESEDAYEALQQAFDAARRQLIEERDRRNPRGGDSVRRPS